MAACLYIAQTAADALVSSSLHAVIRAWPIHRDAIAFGIFLGRLRTIQLHRFAPDLSAECAYHADQRIKRQSALIVHAHRKAGGLFTAVVCKQAFGLQKNLPHGMAGEFPFPGRQITALFNCSLIRDAADNRW